MHAGMQHAALVLWTFHLQLSLTLLGARSLAVLAHEEKNKGGVAIKPTQI